MEVQDRELDFISIDKQDCSNCWHYRRGHCSMYSSECATSVAHHAGHPKWWTSYEEGEANEASVLRTKSRWQG